MFRSFFVFISALMIGLPSANAETPETLPTIKGIPLVEFFDPAQWDKCKKKKGVEICRRSSRVGSAVEVLVTRRINSGADAVLDVIQDADNYCDWLDSCRKAELLEPPTVDGFDYAMVAKTPWPYEDRLLVSSVKIIPQADGEIYTVDSRLPKSATRFKGFPPKESLGARRIRPTGDGQVEVSIYTAINPGGGIPLGLTGSSVRDNAAAALRAMDKEIRSRAVGDE